MASALVERAPLVLSRTLARMATPVVYLFTLGGVQVGLLWLLHNRFGLWIPIASTAGWLALLIMLLASRGHWRTKLTLLYGLIGISGLGPMLFGIIQRPRLGLTIEHDGLIQTEAAVRRVLTGQPIYGVDWSNTALAQMPWGLSNVPNPALHHLAYFPLSVLAGVPVRAITDRLGLPFDGRIVLLLLSLLALGAVAALPIAADRRFMVATALFMSPLITLYLWSGRNDVEFLAFVFLSIGLLARRHPVAGGAALGTAVAFKPFAVFAVPFLLLALYLRWRQEPSRSILVQSLVALAAVPLLTVAPFLVSNPRGFLTDTVAYTSGGVPDAYPIGGYGFGGLLLTLHLVARNTDWFPFALFQLPAMAVALWIFGRRFLRYPTLGRWMAGYTALFAAFAVFARFFNDSYVGVVLTLALCVAPVGAKALIVSAREPAGEIAA